jgi:hypothetical protein
MYPFVNIGSFWFMVLLILMLNYDILDPRIKGWIYNHRKSFEECLFKAKVLNLKFKFQPKR